MFLLMCIRHYGNQLQQLRLDRARLGTLSTTIVNANLDIHCKVSNNFKLGQTQKIS